MWSRGTSLAKKGRKGVEWVDVSRRCLVNKACRKGSAVFGENQKQIHRRSAQTGGIEQPGNAIFNIRIDAGRSEKKNWNHSRSSL